MIDTLITCIICKKPQAKFKFKKEDYPLYSCSNRHTTFVHPFPSFDTLKEYYETEYAEGSYIIHFESDDIRLKSSESRYSELQKYDPKGKILDIGCSTGYFLDYAAKNNLLTYGIELSLIAVKKAKLNHENIINGSLDDSKYQDSFFDVIAMYDIIEHVTNPQDTMKEVSRIIKNNGLLVITTPDIESWHAKVMGKRWGVIMPPEHLIYFSKKSISLLLERYGFEVIEIRKNYKIYTIDYLIRQAKYFYPGFYKILSLIKPLIPERILSKYSRYYIGELFLVARKKL